MALRQLSLAAYRGSRFHDFQRGDPPAEEFHHPFHRRFHMMQKVFEACAEVVQPRFSVGGFEETVFRTATATGRKDIALAAIAGKGSFFRGAEGELLL